MALIKCKECKEEYNDYYGHACKVKETEKLEKQKEK